MKTGQEWHQIYAAQNYTWLEIIKLAQADALEYALQIALAYESQTGRFIAQTIQNKIKELNNKTNQL